MKKCSKPYCLTCPYINERKSVKSGKFNWSIKESVNCDTYNIIYLISCDKYNCQEKYVGESERKLRNRLCEHIGYINSKNMKTPTGKHFNQPGHSVSNLRITILEKIKNLNPLYRKEREKYHIRKFNTFYNGMNRMP